MNRRGDCGQVLTGGTLLNFVVGSVAFFRYNVAFELASRGKMIS
jgi:hypothetical protein